MLLLGRGNYAVTIPMFSPMEITSDLIILNKGQLFVCLLAGPVCNLFLYHCAVLLWNVMIKSFITSNDV